MGSFFLTFFIFFHCFDLLVTGLHFGLRGPLILLITRMNTDRIEVTLVYLFTNRARLPEKFIITVEFWRSSHNTYKTFPPSECNQVTSREWKIS